MKIIFKKNNFNSLKKEKNKKLEKEEKEIKNFSEVKNENEIEKILLNNNLFSDFKIMPEANKAMILHQEEEITGTIFPNVCKVGMIDECIFKDSCNKLLAYDNFIKERMEEDEIINIEVNFCGNYCPKKYISSKFKKE